MTKNKSKIYFYKIGKFKDYKKQEKKDGFYENKKTHSNDYIYQQTTINNSKLSNNSLYSKNNNEYNNSNENMNNLEKQSNQNEIHNVNRLINYDNNVKNGNLIDHTVHNYIHQNIQHYDNLYNQKANISGNKNSTINDTKNKESQNLFLNSTTNESIQNINKNLVQNSNLIENPTNTDKLCNDIINKNCNLNIIENKCCINNEHKQDDCSDYSELTNEKKYILRSTSLYNKLNAYNKIEQDILHINNEMEIKEKMIKNVKDQNIESQNGFINYKDITKNKNINEKNILDSNKKEIFISDSNINIKIKKECELNFNITPTNKNLKNSNNANFSAFLNNNYHIINYNKQKDHAHNIIERRKMNPKKFQTSTEGKKLFLINIFFSKSIQIRSK